jgi:endonuclease/exonuclease/phosphatase (EEP) superfamily protein YafD
MHISAQMTSPINEHCRSNTASVRTYHPRMSSVPAAPVSPPPRPSWLQPTRAARLGLLILLWCTLAGSLMALLVTWLEATPLDETRRPHLTFAYLAFMLRTFTLHAAIALAVAALSALLLRQRVLAALLVAVACCFAARVLAPPFTRAPQPPPADQSRELRLLSMNVLLTNPDATRALAFIRQHDPDIILVQEHTPQWHLALSQALSADYPFIINEMRGNAFGQAVFSKRPFLEAPMRYLTPATQQLSPRHTGVASLHDPQLRVVIDVAGSPVVIQNVHVVPPAGRDLFYEQRAQIAELVSHARDESRPLIMAGDFNATANSHHLRAIINAGMRDLNAAAGTGLGNTWPDLGPLAYVPGIRIDHVLASRHFAVHEHIVGPHTGSDHRPLFVRISLLPASTP